ncbi:MAG: CBS domain-containing protein [Pseudomonadales bacterium]
MQVKDLMTNHTVTCHMSDNVEEVTLKMWNGDFGAVPVIDGEGKVVGIITDRDIAMAEALQHKSASDISVGDVVQPHPVWTCHPDDDIETILETMELHRVRRLPVVHETGIIAGMVSLADIAAYSRSGKNASCGPLRLVNALKAIAAPHTEEDKRVARA